MKKATKWCLSSTEKQILLFAVCCRTTISLVVIISSCIIAPFDTSGHLISNKPFLAAFSNWDGVYFAHISSKGYNYEHMHAFFPLYPLVIRYLSTLIPLGDESLVVAGWLISNLSFLGSIFFLYRLGKEVLGDERAPRRASYLFCIAPSTVFMSSLYSESLMCLCSFSGMYFLELHKRQLLTSTKKKSSSSVKYLIISSILCGLASATRSNGILLSFYIAWHRILCSPNFLRTTWLFFKYWCFTAFLGILAIAPQLAYFAYGAVVYCPHLINDSFKYYFNFDGLILSRKAGEHDRPWCDKIFPNVSSMYMFIQMEYWNVGLFKYYEMKQIPNFLLALPMILMCSHLLAYFFLVPIRKTTKHENVFLLSANASNLRPYCIHLLLLLLNALLVVHIQVTTRLLTACPPVFWGPASFFCNKIPGKYEKAVIGYFLLFNVLGSVLFSTFYPWT